MEDEDAKREDEDRLVEREDEDAKWLITDDHGDKFPAPECPREVSRALYTGRPSSVAAAATRTLALA